MINEISKTNEHLSKYRYPGVTPFSTSQADIFFGREKDAAQLYKLIRRESLVVLYSKSGLGKSSLFNAGIVPLCHNNKDFHPIIIRLGAWTENQNETPLSITKSKIENKQIKPTILDSFLPGDNSLWYYAKSFQLNHWGNKPEEGLLLMFDQFEELFSYPKQEIQKFQEELSELLNTGIPLRFRRLLEASDTSTITEDQEDLLEGSLNLRIVFAIRSDRMHLLDQLKHYLPNILQNTFELEALTIAAARSAILLPSQASGGFKTTNFHFSPAAIDLLLEYLINKQDQRIEGILLQMLCEHYERWEVEEKGIKYLDVLQINDPDQVVKKYYEEKINGLPVEKRLIAQKLIEDGLVSTGEPMRLNLHESYIEHEFGVNKPLLEELVDRRLLRSEPFLRGGYTYELSHDRLVSPVLYSRDRRQKQQAKNEAEKRAKELATTRKQLYLVIWLFVITVIALCTAVHFALDANRKKEIAEKAQEKEKLQLREVKRQKEKVEQVLAKFRSENAEKERLQFSSFEERATAILEVNGCPLDILQEMSKIAENHPDSLAMKEKLLVLESKNPSCG